jgi:hypothetical protein
MEFRTSPEKTGSVQPISEFPEDAFPSFPVSECKFFVPVEISSASSVWGGCFRPLQVVAQGEQILLHPLPPSSCLGCPVSPVALPTVALLWILATAFGVCELLVYCPVVWL